MEGQHLLGYIESIHGFLIDIHLTQVIFHDGGRRDVCLGWFPDVTGVRIKYLDSDRKSSEMDPITFEDDVILGIPTC